MKQFSSFSYVKYVCITIYPISLLSLDLQVQLGEELLAQGDIENGVEHLSNAIAVCGQPQQLLQVLQQTLPPQVFRLLLERLPIVGQV